VDAEDGAAAVEVVVDKIYTGKCHCGAVQYSAEGLSDIWYCHCRQCRELTGHYMAAAGVARDKLHINGDVIWTSIIGSEIEGGSKTGHCPSCHSYMFWDQCRQPTISIIAGTIEDTSEIQVKGHIFVGSKGDYYEITDGLPQYESYPENGTR